MRMPAPNKEHVHWPKRIVSVVHVEGIDADQRTARFSMSKSNWMRLWVDEMDSSPPATASMCQAGGVLAKQLKASERSPPWRLRSSVSI